MHPHDVSARSAAGWRTAGAALLLGALAGCSAPATAEVESPGTNLRVDDVAIRYAHLEAPEDPDGWEAGSDVPLYLWFVNDGQEPVEVTGVSSPLATSVSLSEGALPVQLPPGELVELSPRTRHVVLEDIERQIFGQDLIPVEVAFGDGTEVEFDVEAVDPDVDASPTAPSGPPT